VLEMPPEFSRSSRGALEVSHRDGETPSLELTLYIKRTVEVSLAQDTTRTTVHRRR
jgi:hypothetical protein